MLQFHIPGLLPALRRSPAATHEWWRLITPIFVNRGGWLEIGVNLATLATIGILAERLWPPRAWLLLYFGGGVVGEFAGIQWKPEGAGNSVAVCGLLGGISAWLLLHGRRPAGVAMLLPGALLTLFQNLHGPPLLAGALIGLAMSRRTVIG
jgi:membrane associated rhomboid family serine protease